MSPFLLIVSCVACADAFALTCLDDDLDLITKDTELVEAQGVVAIGFAQCVAEDLSGGLCPQICGTLFNGTLVSRS